VGERLEINEWCEKFRLAIDDWSRVSSVLDQETVQKVRLAIAKSCLLDRIFYCGEKPSQTPCPVHNGRWSGINYRWPGREWRDAQGIHTEIEPGEIEMISVSRGCRCYQHKCGCTTGWQPDEHCGCVPASRELDAQ
jgi:hypothetical protein